MADEKWRAMITQISQELADKGLVIESGWQMYRLIALSQNTPTGELDRLKEAFFAGAQHLFGSIYSMMEPGTEETENDLRRMDGINAELERFSNTMKLKYGRPMGTA
jgi:hypothetical protein